MVCGGAVRGGRCGLQCGFILAAPQEGRRQPQDYHSPVGAAVCDGYHPRPVADGACAETQSEPRRAAHGSGDARCEPVCPHRATSHPHGHQGDGERVRSGVRLVRRRQHRYCRRAAVGGQPLCRAQCGCRGADERRHCQPRSKSRRSRYGPRGASLHCRLGRHYPPARCLGVGSAVQQGSLCGQPVPHASVRTRRPSARRTRHPVGDARRQDGSLQARDVYRQWLQPNARHHPRCRPRRVAALHCRPVALSRRDLHGQQQPHGGCRGVGR